jgi:hypothetical protein
VERGIASLRGDEGESFVTHDLPTHRLTGCYTASRIAFGVEVRSVSYADQVPTGGTARERARDVA